MSRRAVAYALCAPNATTSAVLGREADLRAVALLSDYEVTAFLYDAPETSSDPERPGLAKAVDVMRFGGADALLATGPSGMVMNATNPAAVRDVVRQFAPYGL